MTNLPEIASLWIGGRLSWLEQLCLKSFADAGHHTTLYSYSPIDNLPKGVHAGDAADIFPSEPMLRHARTGSPAIHADMWRLHLLKKTDKIWVDSDMYCHRAFDFKKKSVFGWEKPGLVCNAVLGLPKTSKALNAMLTFFEDEYAIAPWLKEEQQAELRAARDAGRPLHMTEQPWGFTGPTAVTWFLKETGEIRYAEPEAAFYPISFRHRNHMIRPRFNIEERLSTETRGVHFWARRMKPRLQEKENNRPRSGSYMAKVLEKHEIDPDAALIPAKPNRPKLPTDNVLPDVAVAEVAGDHLDVLLAHLKTDRLTRIVDVGANPLSPPLYSDLLARNCCDVYGFEPQTEAFEKLQSSKGERETYFPHAVGDGSDETLYVYRDSSLASMYKPYEGAFQYLQRSRRNMRVEQEVDLKTVRLDDIEDLPPFDVLKIDVQGAEEKILQGGVNKLSEALVVIPETRFYQLYEGEPMFGPVDTELRQKGFQLHKFLFQKTKVIGNSQIDRLKRTRHRNQIIDGDAVYIRDPGQSASWTDGQLKHLAIAASGIFESHDLVLYCLDELVRRRAVDPRLPASYVDALPVELKKD